MHSTLQVKLFFRAGIICLGYISWYMLLTVPQNSEHTVYFCSYLFVDTIQQSVTVIKLGDS